MVVPFLLIASVPEPTTIVLLGAALGLGVVYRKRVQAILRNKMEAKLR
jgi:hypothetical protein